MMIYSLIPILSIYAAWRIQKFWLLLIIDTAIGYAISIPLEAWLGWWGIIPSIAIQIPIGLLIIRHFAQRYNDKIASSNPAPPSSPNL
jgi:hypothetical protein